MLDGLKLGVAEYCSGEESQGVTLDAGARDLLL